MKSGFIAKLHQYSLPPQSKPAAPLPSTLKKSSLSHSNAESSHHPSSANIKVVDDHAENMAPRDRISLLVKQNIELQAKQQRYLEKLSRLEEGLEKQYHESIKLQELYSNLLDSYKAKEEQIRELELRYRVYEESEKRRLDSGQSMQIVRKDNELLQQLLEEHKTRVRELQQQLDQANSSLAMYKAVHARTEQPKGSSFSGRFIDKITALQKDYDSMREARTSLQYENDYLKTRCRDLEEYRHQLDRMTVGKQTEIARLRQEKLNLLRGETERRMAMSPRGLSPRDSSPGKVTQKVKSLQSENRQLKLQLEDARVQITELSSIVAQQRERLYSPEQNNHVKYDDFFSFSKEELQGRTRPVVKYPLQHEWLRKEEQVSNRSERNDQVETSANQTTENQNRHNRDEDNLLPPFPKELQIDSLIRTLEKANERQEPQRWELADG